MTPEQLFKYNLPLFEGVTANDLAGIPLQLAEARYAAWQTLFDQEDKSYDVYFLLSGSIFAVLWTDEGREIVFSRFPKGAYFGELAAFDGQPRSLAVFAKTDARVLTMQRKTFLTLFEQVPVIRNRIVQVLVSRVRRLTARNLEMTTMSVERRVSMYLLRLAVEQDKLFGGAVITDAPTHAEIASSIGANREMVSRSISKLAKQGAVKSSRQRIEILDPAALSSAFS
ncbi:Crp/Fnr family transcriptional regulator [Loktanella agnita]|uniref:Crp/Fnr family transcriptional regulator n=1 Tax=Loktanella agnita TaxID=287097 RepID=UPI0039858D3D